MNEIDELSMLIFRHLPDLSTRQPYCPMCRMQYANPVEWADHLARIVTRSQANWPAMCYIYGTWGYALSQARSLAAKHNRKLWLYKSRLNGEDVWVVSWDPKKDWSEATKVVMDWDEFAKRITEGVLSKQELRAMLPEKEIND